MVRLAIAFTATMATLAGCVNEQSPARPAPRAVAAIADVRLPLGITVDELQDLCKAIGADESSPFSTVRGDAGSMSFGRLKWTVIVAAEDTSSGNIFAIEVRSDSQSLGSITEALRASLASPWTPGAQTAVVVRSNRLNSPDRWVATITKEARN